MAGFENESVKPVIKSHEELIEECLEMGIPVTGHEDQETLEMFLGSTDEEDDDFDDDLDGFEEEPPDDDEIFDEDFDFDEDDDLFEDDEASYN